ncbi:MAG: DNA-directed RNA polymerase subunit alpha [Balneola sp.]|jgi:DNA-directed RNA polymerase subunit alpha|uniref:DNA-directed RNA polymerase subunit alpha n=1 Tax=Pseudomonadati TaxID=3379134 RepID=UPI0007F33132|nr:DNA-directed RNA polymerase subunit alpha [Balneola sp. EhC07]MBO6571649.1 DNA-directed RNA polymerase subunit alpha [Balneola sp.]MBR9918937.1 DNA-directed RNA polymerase subunit alpha [bacterium]MBO6623180.1 DNA-directed RNA polymerase subunit alpha [Balneola sp.]MBO6652250.1 DNA-directed RNA polymerase subunit alpha [Balneola sp.]MBO6712886.1 DNA-directed RNA polymerase subunit alpha [Balneola sp.]
MSNYSIQMPDSLDVVKDDDSFGTFVLQPMERGFGVTIGNSFRRVLLSSLPGIAITAVKINGVDHEYSSIKGVKEDVYEIILNFKQVRFKQVEQSSGVIHISKKSGSTLTAKDIADATAEYEVLNPDLVIAHLADDAELEIELRVGRGRGYVPAEEMTVEDDDVNVIPIDAIFTPIKSVKFDVENVRVGQRTDYEKLVMDVETDGSVNAKEALTIAGKILKEHIEKFITEKIEEQFTQEEEEVDAEKQRVANLLRTSIEDLNLSVRAYNCLKSANINSIGELVARDEQDLLKFRNFGKKSLTELQEVIEEKNLQFGMDVSKFLD